MQTQVYVNPFKAADRRISVTACGCGKAEPNFCRGPHIRKQYIIHYITEGICYYEVNNRKYTITAGDVFVIFPNEEIKYYTDENSLTVSYWIDFVGSEGMKYLNEAGIFHNNLVIHGVSASFGTAIEDLLEHTSEDNYSQLYLEACLLKCLSYIDAANHFQNGKLSSRQKYIKNAISYMEHEYPNKITASNIAQYLNLNRSYFYRIFKEETGLSPTEYLTELRLTKAKKLLNSGESVKATAYSVGIDDIYYFSKLFSSKTGTSPSLFKKHK